MGEINDRKPCIIIVCGLPATGKTSVAMAMSEKLGLPYAGTDYLREQLGLKGQYHPEAKQAVYDRMLEVSRKVVEEGRSIITDGTFHREMDRHPFVDLALKFNARLVWIVLTASENDIATRMQKDRLYSEADLKVYRKLQSSAEPYPEDSLILNTSKQSPEEMVEAIINTLPDGCP